MFDFANQNDDKKYVLVALDIFSRSVHCQPVKSKKKAMSYGPLN